MSLQGTTAGQVRVNDCVDNLMGRIDHATERVESAGYRVSNIVDRLKGTNAPPSKGPTVAPTPIMPSVDQRLDVLMLRIDDLFTQLDRLQNP